MGNLLNTLATVAGSMGVMQRAIAVTSNNVTNAKSPGYVKQRLQLTGKPLELDLGLVGGLGDQGLVSARQGYLERGVQSQAQLVGRYSQQTASLEEVETVFDVEGGTGLARSLDGLFGTFSQLSVNPNAASGRENVIRAAGELARDFRNVSESLHGTRRNTAAEVGTVVDAINKIAESVRGFNIEVRKDSRRQQDPGLDANLHARLEELSDLVDFSVLRGEDGSVNVYLGGQSPLTIGDHHYPVSADTVTGNVVVHDALGADITARIQGGRLRALVDVHNTALPSITSQLDTLAGGVVDRINSALAAGIDSSGQPGAALFQYNASLGAASSVRVTAITTGQIAAASPGAPGGNGNALAVADLATSQEISGLTFSQYYGKIAAGVGHSVSSSREDERSSSLGLAQAKALREELSTVSLDEEAASLIEFQRAYQASAELVRILNGLTETTLGILR